MHHRIGDVLTNINIGLPAQRLNQDGQLFERIKFVQRKNRFASLVVIRVMELFQK